MTTFDDRENRFENEYAHNQEIQFKVDARRDKLIGLWAAEILGMDGTGAEEFAKSIVMADLEEAGDEDVFRKLRTALDKASEKVSDEEIRQKMEEFLAIAKKQLHEGK